MIPAGDGLRRWAVAAAHGAPAVMVMWLLAAPLSTAAAEILLGLACAATLLARASGPRAESWPYGWRSPLVGGRTTGLAPWLWLAFIAWYLISVLASVNPTVSAGKLPKLFRYALFFLPLAVPWRAVYWRAACWIQLPLLLVLGGLGLESLLAGMTRAQTYNMHYNTLAQVAAMSSLFLLAAALYGPATARRERSLFFSGCLFAAAVMVATLSRAAWVAWWLAAVVLILLRLPRRAALAATAILVLVPVLSAPLILTSRPDLLDLRDPEFTRRYDMWRMAAAVIRDHPLTGLGPGGLDVVYDQYRIGVLVEDPRVWSHVHNDLLGIALSHGIPAAAIWLVLAVIFYRTAVRRLLASRRDAGSWSKARFAGVGASLHLYYMFGIVHENHPIYVKACTMLLLWGLFVAADRDLDDAAKGPGDTSPSPAAQSPAG